MNWWLTESMRSGDGFRMCKFDIPIGAAIIRGSGMKLVGRRPWGDRNREPDNDN